MKTVIRNSYAPKLGDYCDTIVVDKETSSVYFFDCDGVWTELDKVDADEILAEAAAYTDAVVVPINEKLDTIEEGAQVNKIEHVLRNGTELTITNKTVNVTVPTKTSDLANDGSDGTDTYVESAALNDYYTKTETDTQIGYETTAREIADSGLQEQIDAIVASSDVVDIVGTYAALLAYDTTKLHDNDIIKVLDDETRDDATTYYRWDADTSTWSYIGAEGPFYTKAEADAIFTPMTRTINSKALNSDITLTAADVGALPDSTVIPTVNDATLTIQQNGTTVQTFTANQATNATANITVPTDTADLTNGAGFITSADLPTKTSDLTNDGSDGTSTYVEADDLATVATTGAYSDLTGAPTLAAVATSGDYDDLINKPTIPTVNDATLTIQKNGTDVATFTANSATNQTANITVPTDTNDLTNGAGFITTAALTNYYTKSETYSQGEVNSLIGAITVPTKTSDLTNDGSDGNSTYVEASDLATVATTGNYSDLNGAPGDFTGTDGVNAGVHGLVPAPTASDVNKYLKSDGTWATVQGGGGALTTFIWSHHAMYDVNSNPVTFNDVHSAFDGGEVVIYDNASGNSYVATSVETESGIEYVSAVSTDLSEGENSVKSYVYQSGSWSSSSNTLQNKLTAGTNITISSGTISAPSAVSAFTNDAGYLTTAGLSNYYTKSETYSQQEVNALINAIFVPTKTSDLTNDGSDGNSTYVEADDLATVATTGDYDDLTNKPTLPTDFTGATSSTAGSHGLVPAPAAGDEGKFLQGDGTWATVTPGQTYTAGNGIGIDANNEISVDTTVVATQTDLAGKQDTLTAGTNISISSNTISASIPIDSALDVSSTNPVENSVVTAALNNKANTSDLANYVTLDTNQNITGEKTFVGNKRIKFKGTASNSKLGFTTFDQNNGENGFFEVEGASTASKKVRLGCYDTASGGSTRDNYVGFQYHNTRASGGTVSYNLVCPPQYRGISGTNAFAYIPVDFTDGNTTIRSDNTGVLNLSTLLPSYSDFTGATSSTAGANGLVPAPAAGDEGKYLKGDGTWATVQSGTSYTAGTGIDITNGTISVDNTVAMAADLPSTINSTDWSALWQ